MAQFNVLETRNLLLVTFLSFCAAALPFATCSAGGAQGSGGDAGSCQTLNGKAFTQRGSWLNYPAVTCEAAGVGWAYFTYVNGWNQSLDFAPSTKGEGGAKTIPQECTKWGGFYHFGYMDKKSGTSPDNDGSGYTVTNGRSKAVLNGYASIGNIARLNGTIVTPSWKSPHWQKDNYGNELPPSISHKITVNGTVAAVGDHFEYDSSVKQKYLKWLEVAPAGTPNIWDTEGSGGIAYFCYGSVIDEPTTFTHSSQGYVNNVQKGRNSTTTVSGDSATINYKHTISRNNKGPNSVTEWYEVKGNWPKGGSKNTAFAKGESKTVYMPSARTVSILPGQTLSYEQHLKYDTSSKGNESSAPVKEDDQYILKIYRPPADSITGWSKAKVNNSEKSNNSTTEVTDGKYTISFQHTLKRGSDAAGGTATSHWKTSVSSSDSAGRSVNPGGTARSGDQSLSINQEKNVVTYSTETFSGTLLPDETRTFCQALNYEYEINAASGNKSRNAPTYCVKVHRPASPISNCGNQDLSVNTGKNSGQIGVVKRNVSTGAYNEVASVYEITGNHLLEVWARPSQIFKFEEGMCEAAELPNQYQDFKKNITYTIEANKPGTEIMRGSIANSTPTSWKNASINSYANAGKDIWGGSTYTNANYSPKSSYNNGYHTVKESYAGQTLEQKLSFTDLWIENGNISAGHAGTKNVNMVAQVHVPYNYTLEPKTSTGGNRWTLPGTNTLTIQTDVTVKKRKNTPVNSDEPYATQTKPTKVQVVSFMIPSNRTKDQVSSVQTYDASAGGNAELWRVCGAFIRGGPYNCQSHFINHDANGDVIAANATKDYGSANIVVPENTPIGVKVCAVVAVWPADSHNRTGDIYNEDEELGALTGTAEDNRGRLWGISKPSCVTTAKKPNFQVRQNSTYAQRDINTAVSDRARVSDGAVRSYGSWSDYEIVSGGKNIGMGSGAIFWNGISFSGSEKRACVASALSVSNTSCANSTATVGNATNSTSRSLSSHPANVYQKLLDRYTTNSGARVLDAGTGIKDVEWKSFCRYDGATRSYTPYPADNNISCLENGAALMIINGSARIGGVDMTINPHMNPNDGNDDNTNTTYVVEVKGTLYIGRNERYADYPTYSNRGYRSLHEVPQNIYIADDIKIAPNVTHLDAWLVARNSINTCYISGSGETREQERKRVSVDNCNNQLTVTGPVIAKELRLYRTFGGGITSGAQFATSDPSFWRQEDSEGAEVFKISPFTYLWSFSQAERYSQATTTYQRELPARY